MSKEMNQDQINVVLTSHRAWLCGEGGERANLQEADLRLANLLVSNLQESNLQGANLGWANLRGADLRDADLLEANLLEANLLEANDVPIQMQVGPWLVHIHGGYMKIGCEHHSVNEWKKFKDKRIELMDEYALEFWQQNRKWLLAACDAQMQTIRND